MRYLSAIVLIFVSVYVAGIFLEVGPTAREIDPELGLEIAKPGSDIWRFTEGAAISRYKEHGLNAALPDGKANVYLYGDSYIEGLMLPDEAKADFVLTKALGGSNLVWGVSRSGAGIPSCIVRAREYERVFGLPRLHIFFVSSSGDITGDLGNEFVWDEKGVRKCASKTTPNQQRIAEIANRLRLNIIVPCNNALKELKRKQWKFLPRFGRKANAVAKTDDVTALRDKFDFLCDEIVRSLKAPVLFVYCPTTPTFANGVLSYPEIEDCFRDVKKIDFFDATSALNGLYRETGHLPRGFANASGPGSGHLNAEGVEAVFTAVATYLKENYAL